MADTKLNGKKVLMVIPHTQFRDEEFFEPKAILEDGGAAVRVASTSARTCYGMKGGVVNADLSIADAKPSACQKDRRADEQEPPRADPKASIACSRTHGTP